ncbi:MAG: DUF5615 family PIN-like protein [Caldilineaceae bacterium]|nr:DUF5615 family PIN-like protein [Caldilineaceae bacterium]MCB0124799.1 DUF5615 family PIN-like protein [Caldilineaceae bacterium]
MQIKTDENLPPIIAEKLRELGHDAATVLEQDMGGWKDNELWIAVQAEERYLITADKGFADIRQFPPGTHSGVLLLRPDEDGIRPLLNLMDYVLKQQPLENLQGLTTVATPRGLRIRRPMIYPSLP